MIQSLLNKITNATTLAQLQDIKVEALGKKGYFTLEFSKMKTVENSKKKEFAQNLNTEKNNFNSSMSKQEEYLNKIKLEEMLKSQKIDVTKFNTTTTNGATHPVHDTMHKITTYFRNLNFDVEQGPLIEDDFHNFQALNLPQYHPARDMQDTFYCKDSSVLRTHTSPVQIRTMMKKSHPIRMIAPGNVFRKDFDITHTPMFNQIEGLVVDSEDKISFANLKHLMIEFLHHMFGDVEIRFRPSYFPFTEPSAEVDISCKFCKAKGCRICSNTGWLEVLGCGIVDQNVFKEVGYENVSGYAFGLGIERFAMLINEINDLRSLFESDLRLLGQFR